MSEQLIVVISDLAKHILTTYYIKFEDTKLNLLVYAFLSIVISFILKIIFNFESFKEQIKHTNWFIRYKIFRTKITIYPCHKEMTDTYYSPFIMDKDRTDRNKLKQYELFGKSKYYFLETLSIRLYKNRSFNKNNEHVCDYIYNFRLDTNSVESKPSKVKVTYQTFNNYFESKAKDLKVIAFINGYYIMIDVSAFNTREDEDIRIMSTDRGALESFMKIIQNDIDENKSLIAPNKGYLEVVEYDRKTEIIKLGNVKPALCFDNYISRHKLMILRKLESFINGNLYKGNPYFENNLGFMLHGFYGTGKTFLISAIANYLKRNIYTVNFSKIKTKSEFRYIMNPDNIEKYVYSFDEFDILLGSLLNTSTNTSGDKAEQAADLKTKIQCISMQINSCNDPDEKQVLIEQMKTLIDNGNSDILTLDFLLGEMSGLTSITKRVIIASTNFPEKIPKALLRPGRFDIVLHLGHFNDTEIKELLIKLYKPNGEDLKTIKKTVFKNDKYTPAQLIMLASDYLNVNDLITVLTKNTGENTIMYG